MEEEGSGRNEELLDDTGKDRIQFGCVILVTASLAVISVAVAEYLPQTCLKDRKDSSSGRERGRHGSGV